MNMKTEPLDKGQKVDAAEIAAILRGAPASAELLCRMAASAYIAGIKAGAAMRTQAAGPGA